ncbi:MAG: HAD family hydrolase [Phycisphaerae bacterium]
MKGIVFDLDGTLADTLPSIADAINYGLAAIGRPEVSRDEVRRWIGEGLPTLCRRALPDADEETFERMMAAVSQHYREHQMDKTVPFPGITELMDELTRRGVLMGVLSNKPHVYTVPMTQGLFGRWPLVAIEGYREEERRKPDPRTLLDIVARMEAKPSEVMLVGDSNTDIATARNAGVIPIGATWGYRDRDELIVAGAAYLIDAPGQLLALI